MPAVRRQPPPAAVPGSGGGVASGGVGRAHDADGVPIGVGHHGVPGTPEGVVRRLLTRIPRRGQACVDRIDRVAFDHSEAKHGSAVVVGPAFVPLGGEAAAVDVEVETPGRFDRSMMFVPRC